MKKHKTILSLVLACVMCPSCYVDDVSKEGPISKGSVITLQEPYYFIDNPGDDQLVAVKDFKELPSFSKSKTLLPKGTRIQYLKTIRVDAFMAPMPRTTAYGSVIGMAGMTKVNIDALIRDENVRRHGSQRQQ